MPTPATPTSDASSPRTSPYDALLIVSFGGPEKPEDVMPFLENVTRGRNIPRERLLEVAEHYHHFGGVSPINQQTRDLMSALRPELDRRGIDLPLYWGNRNWHPMLDDTLREMTTDGAKHALALVLAGFSSYSSCRQYRENIQAACLAAGPGAPTVDKVRVFYNHPDFIAANADRVREALERIPADRRSSARLAFTAHSIPTPMAETSNYAEQLRESCRLVAESLGIPEDRWALVYQSRSGRPTDPWLEPDILDHLDAIHGQGTRDIIVHPIGFLSDHLEVLYDLDEEAHERAKSLGMGFARAGTVGVHPRFVAMLAELIAERIANPGERRAIGRFGPSHDACPANCCLPMTRHPGPPIARDASEQAGRS